MADIYQIKGVRKKIPNIRKAKRKIDKFYNDNRGKSVYISKHKTNLVLDKYSDIIIRVLNSSKASIRSQGKSMMTPRGREDGHLTTRGKHQQEVADIAVQIAHDLGLNADLARAQAEHHDDGHTFNGHFGERIMNTIGQLYNCGYSVHNALSIDMLNSEDIINKIKDTIKMSYPEVTNEELNIVEDEIIEYVFDGILAHNGEGVDRAISPQFNKTKQNIIEEKNKCYSIKGYDKKIKPKTMEGAILRFADIIAYTKTDILDGFRLNLISGFDEKGVKNGKPIEKGKDNEYYQGYLKVIGTVLSYKDKLEKKESQLNIDEENRLRIEAKNINRRIFQLEEQIKKERSKFENLRDNSEEKTITNQQIKNLVMQKEDEKVKLIETQNAQKEYDAKKIEVAKKYLEKIPDKDKKEKVTDLMQNIFIKDLVEYSKDKDYIGFSPAIGEALFKLREHNLNYIVKYTRREFETKVLPDATLKLVDILSKTLIDTGIIYEEILSDEIKKKIVPLGNPEQYEEERKRLMASKFEKQDKEKYKRKVFHRCENLYKDNCQRMKEICENAMNSIPNIAEHDLHIAENRAEIDMKISEEDKKNSLLYAKYSEKIENIRKLLKEHERDCVSLSDTEKKNIIIKDAVKNIEQIYANALAKEYVEGMSDDTIIYALELMGIITNAQATNARNRKSTNDVEIDPATQELGDSWVRAGKNDDREGLEER